MNIQEYVGVSLRQLWTVCSEAFDPNIDLIDSFHPGDIVSWESAPNALNRTLGTILSVDKPRDSVTVSWISRPVFSFFGRRVNVNAIANSIVSIQPLPAPKSLVFYQDFSFGTSVNEETKK